MYSVRRPRCPLTGRVLGRTCILTAISGDGDERALLARTLVEHQGSVIATARALGYAARSSVWYAIDRYGLRPLQHELREKAERARRGILEG